MEHVLSEEVVRQAQMEIDSGNHWMAYNTSNYFLEKGDVEFFREKGDAEDFCVDQSSDHDRFGVKYVNSIQQLFSQLPYGEEINKKINLIIQNHSVMNEMNLEYLKNNIKYHGFGENLNEELTNQIKSGQNEFTLQHSAQFNHLKMDATLHIKKGDQNDMYFFNKYDAKLTKADKSEVEQVFYLDKGKGFTIKEATNLLDGRSVNKDMENAQKQPYNAWFKLDFDNKNESGNHLFLRYHENYGYDLEKALGKQSFKELEDPTQKDMLSKSLMKGNLQSVTEQTGEKIFIAAEPESGRSSKIAKYDSNLKEITVEIKNENIHVRQDRSVNEVKAEDKTEGQSKGQKKSSSDSGKEETDLLPKSDKKKRKTKEEGTQDGLLNKNRQSSSKGVKM